MCKIRIRIWVGITMESRMPTQIGINTVLIHNTARFQIFTVPVPSVSRQIYAIKNLCLKKVAFNDEWFKVLC
jgi:hypothetical protein